MIHPADRLGHVEEYYFSKKLKEIRQLQADGKPIINLGIGSPDLSPEATVIETLEKEAKKAENHGYQPYQGIPELSHAVRSFYQSKYKVDTEALSVLPLMGSKEGITHLSLGYLNKGDLVLIPALGYPTYTSVTRMVEAEPVYFPLLEETGWEPDWDFLEKVDTSRVKILWINYPHMPTGKKASPELLKKYVDFARKHEILLCHDNPYSFVLNDQPLSIFNVEGAEEVAIELNSLSKTFNMAGWRVGWMLGKDELIQPALQIKSNMDSGMFKPVQLAAVKALQLGDEWYDTINKEYQARRTLVFQILDNLGCTYEKDQSGMFVWAKVPNGTGVEFSDRLLYDKSVFITPGIIFGDAGQYFIRVSLCTSQDQFREVLNRII